MPKATLFYAQSDPLSAMGDLCPKWLKIYALRDPPALVCRGSILCTNPSDALLFMEEILPTSCLIWQIEVYK